jgi:hypothetical protein
VSGAVFWLPIRPKGARAGLNTGNTNDIQAPRPLSLFPATIVVNR